MNATSKFINSLAKERSFSRYLEIGVNYGATFFDVNMEHKTAVDPKFLFNVDDYKSEKISFYSETSDDFFKKLPDRLALPPFCSKDFKFDIIYIDGLHTFEQSFLDFRNAIKYIHDDSIVIFDDTLPTDPYSAIPDQEKSLFYRKIANVGGEPWHGDVYKTIFAIHDFHPEFCYATNISTGNPQTIVWRAKKEAPRPRAFNSLGHIVNLSYFDMLDCADLLVPVEEKEAVSLIGKDIDVDNHVQTVDYVKIIPPLTLANYRK